MPPKYYCYFSTKKYLSTCPSSRENKVNPVLKKRKGHGTVYILIIVEERKIIINTVFVCLFISSLPSLQQLDQDEE